MTHISRSARANNATRLCQMVCDLIGNGCELVEAQERAWASATFNGARHIFTLRVPIAKDASPAPVALAFTLGEARGEALAFTLGEARGEALAFTLGEARGEALALAPGEAREGAIRLEKALLSLPEHEFSLPGEIVADCIVSTQRRERCGSGRLWLVCTIELLTIAAD